MSENCGYPLNYFFWVGNMIHHEFWTPNPDLIGNRDFLASHVGGRGIRWSCPRIADFTGNFTQLLNMTIEQNSWITHEHIVDIPELCSQKMSKMLMFFPMKHRDFPGNPCQHCQHCPEGVKVQWIQKGQGRCYTPNSWMVHKGKNPNRTWVISESL